MLSVNDHDATLLPSARQSWSWRDGIMIVQDAPLQEVMQRLQPYALPPVVFNDARAPLYRLSGTIDLSQPDQFIHALPSLVPVRVLEKTDGTLMIAARK
jgi:transmembrane sensor